MTLIEALEDLADHFKHTNIQAALAYQSAAALARLAAKERKEVKPDEKSKAD